jgi:hypothetical protein
MRPAGVAARGRGVEVGGGGRKLEGGGRKELEGTRLARQDRRWETFGSSSGRPEVYLHVSDASGGGIYRQRPAGGQWLEERRRVAREVRRELELEHGRPPSRR